MNKRRIAALGTAAFAGLLLSSPSFSQNTSGITQTPAQQTTAPATGVPGRGSVEERGAASKEVVAAANAGYKSAVEKCDALPIGGRSSCMADARSAHALAMSDGRDGPPATK